MKLNPTAEQHNVINASAPKIIVSAAAGAGKTFVLVERYLRILQDRPTPDALRPDNILTITFTRKAAAEMKDRIVRRLHDAGLEQDAQIAETGPIQTIHGFCERVLKENAIEAALDPDFEVIVGAETQQWREELILDTLANPDEDDETIHGLLEMLAGSFTRNGTTPQAALQRAIEVGLGKLRGSGRTPDELLAMYATPEATLETWRLQLVEDLDPTVAASLDFDQPLGDQIVALYKQMRKKAPSWAKVGADDRRIAVFTSAYVRLVTDVWRQLEARMRRRGKLDFTLLEQMAVDLVATNPVVQARLQRQYQVVFIDEAQDLNPVQYKLLTGLGIATELMVGDAQQSIYGFRQADRQLFVERQGESDQTSLTLSTNHRSDPGILAFVDRVFGEVWAEDYQPMLPAPAPPTTEGNVLFLNFEAAKPNFDGVELWPMAMNDATRVAELIKHMQTPEAGQTEPAFRLRDICILVRKGFFALKLQNALKMVGIESQIIGANEEYYTRLEVRDIANALRWLSDPHDNYAALATLRSPFVDVTLDTFILLAKRRQSGQSVYEQILEATAHPGQSDLPPEDIDRLWELRRWFDDLATHADRLSAWEVMGDLFARTRFLETLGRREGKEQMIANARKLLILAAEQPEIGPREFAESVRDIQRIAHRESQALTLDEDADAIRIMTIHKSKGLEFPVVIVPETLSPEGSSEKEIYVDVKAGLIAACFHSDYGLMGRWLQHRDDERSREEGWRVLYVAMTRAQKRLCLVLRDSPDRKRSLGGELAGMLRLDKQTDRQGLVVREYGTGKLDP